MKNGPGRNGIKFDNEISPSLARAVSLLLTLTWDERRIGVSSAFLEKRNVCVATSPPPFVSAADRFTFKLLPIYHLYLSLFIPQERNFLFSVSSEGPKLLYDFRHRMSSIFESLYVRAKNISVQ